MLTLLLFKLDDLFYGKTSCVFFQGALSAVPAEAGLAGTQADQAVLNC